MGHPVLPHKRQRILGHFFENSEQRWSHFFAPHDALPDCIVGKAAFGAVKPRKNLINLHEEQYRG